jgi:regulator of extracellular matrix RemA (YlzA/DUF370 family)
MPLGSVTADRYLADARKRNKFHSAAAGRKGRSQILLDDGTVIISCIKPKTLMARLNGEAADNIREEEEDDDENNLPIGEDS